MSGFVHEGKNLVVPAPYEVHAGDGVMIGALFGIAASWAEAGQLVPLAASGVFDVPRPGAEEWKLGTRIYWDDSTRAFTCMPDGGRFVGVVVDESKQVTEGKGRLRINGIAA